MKWRIKELVDQAFDVQAVVKTGRTHRIIHAVISREDKEASGGETVLIKITPIEIPKSHLVFIGGYARHPLGTLIAVIEEPPKMIDVNRRVKVAAFHTWKGGTIEKGDVIGIVEIVQTEL
jgi:hypothetical protein